MQVKEQFQMKYTSFGNGERVMIILPGLSLLSVVETSAEAVKKAYNAFLEEYTIYLFDRKNNPEESYDIKAMSEDTVKVIESLGLKNLHIFGASEGGMMGLQMAIDHPELVKKLVVGSACCQFDADRTEIADKWYNMAKNNLKQQLIESMIDTLYSEKTLRQYRDYLISLYRNVTDEQVRIFAINEKAMFGFDVYDRLSEIKGEVLIMHSRGDKFFGYQSVKKMTDKLNCDYYIYDDSYGHAVYDEAADYTERIHRFFNS